uniref:L1 transposable element RRM domain-containing protein n=1 Tax=Oryzias sinensis TaxID=183150 RepID=A0A8C7XN71_9TELE
WETKTYMDLFGAERGRCEAEERVSAVEDECCVLKGKVEDLEKRNKALEDKLVDMETRSRLNNIRVVGLPEGAEGPDPCSFLENWLADALDMGPLRAPLVLERAHRVGPRRATGDPPRPLIMRFLNYKQKVAVMNAARKKGDIRYKNINVRLYNDLATEVHKQRKQYDTVRAQLRRLGLRHGFRPPTKLLVTYKERTHTFDNVSQENKRNPREILLDNTA